MSEHKKRPAQSGGQEWRRTKYDDGGQKGERF